MNTCIWWQPYGGVISRSHTIGISDLARSATWRPNQKTWQKNQLQLQQPQQKQNNNTRNRHMLIDTQTSRMFRWPTACRNEGRRVPFNLDTQIHYQYSMCWKKVHVFSLEVKCFFLLRHVCVPDTLTTKKATTTPTITTETTTTTTSRRSDGGYTRKSE